MEPQHLELLTSVLAIEGQLPRLSLKPGQQHIKTPLCPHQLHITVHQSAPGTCSLQERDTGGFPKLADTEMRAVRPKFRSDDRLLLAHGPAQGLSPHGEWNSNPSCSSRPPRSDHYPNTNSKSAFSLFNDAFTQIRHQRRTCSSSLYRQKWCNRGNIFGICILFARAK